MVELLAWIYDHNSGRSLKGFKLMPLGWSDGVNFLPLFFVLCSSAKANKQVQGIKKELDKRTCGYKRRLEAVSKSTVHLEAMVTQVLSAGYVPIISCLTVGSAFLLSLPSLVSTYR